MTELQRHFADSAELRRYIRERSPDGTVLLSLSLGKDSIAAWLALREIFPRIVPFYLELVPGLGFVERELERFETLMGTPILRYPHPSLYRMIRNMVYQPPERCAWIEQFGIPRLDYPEIERDVRKKAGAPNAFVALGTRAVDSPIRRYNLMQNGPINVKRNSFWAVYDWKIDDVIDAIRKAGVKLPVDYKMFGRSFDGVDFRFLQPIREMFPDDYRKILRWFPLADLDIVRRQFYLERTRLCRVTYSIYPTTTPSV